MSTLDTEVVAVKVLTDLGFTATQARAYFALCQNGISDAKTISKESRIARQDVYRVLAGLEEMGFIEKTLTKPAMFKAVPLQETIDVLTRKEKLRSHELWEKTQRLLKKLEAKNEKLAFVSEKPRFILIPEGKTHINKVKEAIFAAQASMDCVTSYKRFLQILHFAGEEIMKALQKGVKLRFILVKPTKEKPLPRILQKYCKDSQCSIRYFVSQSPPQARIAIYDRREVHIAISTNENFMKSSMLVTTCQPIVSIINEYFEIVWSKESKNL